jgi:hypothetical protein
MNNDDLTYAYLATRFELQMPDDKYKESYGYYSLIKWLDEQGYLKEVTPNHEMPVHTI